MGNGMGGEGPAAERASREGRREGDTSGEEGGIGRPRTTESRGTEGGTFKRTGDGAGKGRSRPEVRLWGMSSRPKQ